MGGAFIAGTLAIFSPGLALLVPGYAAFIAARSLNQTGTRTSKTTALIAAAGFIAGFCLVFVALNASATAVGQYLVARLDFFSHLAGTVVVLFGLLIAFAVRTGGPLGALVLGLSFAIGFTPTLSPSLAAVLVAAGRPDSLVQGLVHLASYALGLAALLLLIALTVDLGLGWARGANRVIQIVSGALIIGTGVLIFTNR